jgi:NAD(P)H-hydrate repair Nnr-like enzyme with NAD(P)H-hydrate dehydratase domain
MRENQQTFENKRKTIILAPHNRHEIEFKTLCKIHKTQYNDNRLYKNSDKKYLQNNIKCYILKAKNSELIRQIKQYVKGGQHE